MDARKNVLVCEHDPVQMQILRQLLDRAGYHSLPARTPAEAFAAARQGGIDAVVTDVRPDSGGGIAVVEGLRRIGLDAPVILASGLREQARKAGVARFFDQPVELPERIEDVPAPKLGRVLILEPDPEARGFLSDAAEAAGFEVQAVERLSEALAAGGQADLALAAGDAATIAALKAVRPELFVALICPADRRDLIRESYRAGASSVLRLPVAPAQVESFLKQNCFSARELKRTAGAAPAKRRIVRRSPRRAVAAILTMAAFGCGLLAAAFLGWAQRGVASLDDAATRALRRVEQVAGADPFSRWATLEQLRLLRSGQEAERRFQELQLDELRLQNSRRSLPPPPIVIEPPVVSPASPPVALPSLQELRVLLGR